MCKIATAIKMIWEVHRDMARVHGMPAELEEFNLHLAIEAEKYLRRHEAKCKECQKEEVRA